MGCDQLRPILGNSVTHEAGGQLLFFGIYRLYTEGAEGTVSLFLWSLRAIRLEPLGDDSIAETAWPLDINPVSGP